MAPSMERAARGTKDTRLLTNQPYDESLEVIDSEEVASVYSPTPCGGHSQVTRQPGDRGTGGPVPPRPHCPAAALCGRPEPGYHHRCMVVFIRNTHKNAAKV